MIQLKTATASVEGFQSYKMMSTMVALSDVFELTSPNSLSAGQLKAGTPCQVLMDGELIISGGIDRVRYSSSERILTWTGRDKTRHLVDSCPVVASGEWKGVYAREIIASLASPFGITVEGEDGRYFKQYNAELDLPCHVIIAEICSLSGILATSTPTGNVLLTKAEPTYSEISLQEGHNITTFEMIADVSKAFKTYKIIGQQSFIGTDLNSATQPFGEVSGTGESERLKVIISPNSIDFAAAQVQADWIASESEASKEYLKATIAEYANVQPNTLIPFTSETLGISSMRLIETVLWEYSPEKGHQTSFVLVNPLKYGGTPEEFTSWL